MLLSKLQWTTAVFATSTTVIYGRIISIKYYYQASNPYIGKLSILDDELALNVSLIVKVGHSCC